jgi:hypothetical protein
MASNINNMQTYKTTVVYPSDSKEERMKKLYVDICSVGEQLYSAGSLLSEINKNLLELEAVTANLRRDYDLLK